MRLLNLAKLGVALAVLMAQLGLATQVWADSVPSTPAAGQPTSAGGDPVSAVTPGSSGAPDSSGTSGAHDTPANGAPEPGSPSTSSGGSGSSGTGTATGSLGTTGSGIGPGTTTGAQNGAPAGGGSPASTGGDQSAGGGTVPSAPSGTEQNGGTPGAPNGRPNVPPSDGVTPPQPPATGANGVGATSGPDPTTPPSESNTTSQNIWQLQISGCTSNCQGTTQTQAAEQQNTTEQVLDGTGGLPTATGTQTGSGAQSQSTANITQIQLGCVANCFGSTTTTSAAISTAALQALQQVLSDLGAPGSQRGSPGEGTEQNTVAQSIAQWQDGAPVQSQDASQNNVTAQVTGFTGSVASELQAALVPSASVVAGVSNETQQSIWQLQVGCIIFCSGTVQSQKADQSNTTVQVVVGGAASAVQTGAEAMNIATQLIWQLQVGCLFWCYDTVQIQSAASSNTTLQAVGTGPAPPGPPPPPPPPPGQTNGNGSVGPPDTSGGSQGALGSGGSQGTAGSGDDPGTLASGGEPGTPVGGRGSATPPAGGVSGTSAAGGGTGNPGQRGASGSPASRVGSTGTFLSTVSVPMSPTALAGAPSSGAPAGAAPSSTAGGVAETTGQTFSVPPAANGATRATDLVVISTVVRAVHMLGAVTRDVTRAVNAAGSRQAMPNLPRLSTSFPAVTATSSAHGRIALSPAEIALLTALGIVLLGLGCLRLARAGGSAR